MVFNGYIKYETFNMTSVFDITTYKSAAVAGALYYVLQTEAATNFLEGILPFASAKRAEGTSRDTMPVIITKTVLAVLGFRLIDNMINSQEEDVMKE